MTPNNSKQLFNIDEIDRSIIQIIQEDPNLTHTEIARKVNRSQPAVGMRIRKLEEAGVLKFQAGISLKNADLILARAEIETREPVEIEDLVKKCPYMINAFRLSGSSNISVLLVGFVFKDLDNIINCHFRTNPQVKNVVLEIISDVVTDFILPFNLNFDKCRGYSNGVCCCVHLGKANES
jgi:DNA-binding Lrp family transcriptional regulator